MPLPHSNLLCALLVAAGTSTLSLAARDPFPQSLPVEKPAVTLANDGAEKIPDALARAVALSSLVEDDEFQSRLKRDLVEFHLSKGFHEAALKLAEGIPDYRRGIALAQVAAARARIGDTKRIEQVLDSALNQSGFPHQWQGEAIRAEVAIAWAAAGEEARGSALLEKFTDDGAKFRAKAGLAVERARRGESYDPTTFDAPTDPVKLQPELLQLARAAIEIGELRMTSAKLDKDEVSRLCAQSEAVVRACKATAGEELLDTGTLWRRLGDPKKAAELIGLALHHLPPGVELQGWRAGYFARMVGLYVEAGEKERVSAMLAAGRKGIQPMHAFHQPPALCQLAEAELVAGLPEQAEETWTEAVRIAIANPNPPSRFLGAAQVAFSIARTGRELPKNVSDQFALLTSSANPSASTEK